MQTEKTTVFYEYFHVSFQKKIIMKNCFFFTLLIMIGLSSCSKDREADPNILPEATQTGANTGGAIVDGKVWVATKDKLNGNHYVSTYCEVFNFGVSDKSYKIKIGLENIQNRNSYIVIDFKTINIELNKQYIFPVDASPDNESICTYKDAVTTNVYITKFPDNLAKIKITRLDIQNQIISGTFEFKAIDNNGNLVNITNGRFDKKFD